MGESKGCMVARDSGGHGIEESDRGADERHSDRREGDLSDRQDRTAGEDGDDDRADHARAAVEGGKTGGQAHEEGERVDGQREQQPPENPMPKALRMMPMTIMLGGLRDKFRAVALSTTSTA